MASGHAPTERELTREFIAWGMADVPMPALRKRLRRPECGARGPAEIATAGSAAIQTQLPRRALSGVSNRTKKATDWASANIAASKRRRPHRDCPMHNVHDAAPQAVTHALAIADAIEQNDQMDLQ